MDLLESLKLSFKPEAFGDTVAGLDSRLAAYIADAEGLTTIPAAREAWARVRAYSDQIEYLRQVASSTTIEGRGQVSRAEIAARIASITLDRDAARATFVALTAPTLEARPPARARSRSIPVEVVW